MNVSLTRDAGVVETGLFLDMASRAYFGNENGLVTTRRVAKSGVMNGKH